MPYKTEIKNIEKYILAKRLHGYANRKLLSDSKQVGDANGFFSQTWCAASINRVLFGIFKTVGLCSSFEIVKLHSAHTASLFCNRLDSQSKFAVTN